MNHGLSEATVATIHAIFARFPEIERAILFGSRAKGCARPGSDIDLTLVGPIDHATLSKIEEALDDSPLPYLFSLSAYATLKDPDLLAHIARVGVTFYTAPSRPSPIR